MLLEEADMIFQILTQHFQCRHEKKRKRKVMYLFRSLEKFVIVDYAALVYALIQGLKVETIGCRLRTNKQLQSQTLDYSV